MVKEIEMMKHGQILISALQLATLKAECLHALMKKNVTALCFEHLLDEGGSLTVVRAMSEIVGRYIHPDSRRIFKQRF
jgi:alanine dehydrogenase